MALQISTRSSKVTCLCGAVTEPGTRLVADSFPITAGLCSCAICRQSSGALGIIPIQLNGPPSSESLAACKVYTASDRAERYFCSTCGSHVFLRHSKVDKWFTIAGVVERRDDAKEVDTVKIEKIGFLKETRDGGIASRMRSVALTSSDIFTDVKCYAGMPIPGTDVPLLQADTLWQASTPPAQEHADDKFVCACHCGKVQFYITRPGDEVTDHRRLFPKDSSKYVAKLCVCSYCRLATSTPFMPWMYIMPHHVFTPTGENLILGFDTKLENLPGAQVYYSSEDSKRSFCGTCGATLFYECESRPELIDISVGIFRSERGVLAEDILNWDWPWVSWDGSGRDNTFQKNLTAE